MLEVVFSDSAKGSIKVAKNYDKKSMMRGATAYIGGKPSKKELEKLYEGEPVGGSPRDVISVGFQLDTGDISGEIDGEERKREFLRLYGSVSFDENEVERFFSAQREDYERLLDSAQNNEPIRVWKSDAPYSACGFCFVCDALREYNCALSVIELPQYFEASEDTVQSCADWGEIAPGRLYRFLPLERKVSEMEKRMQGSLWKKLIAENAPLRALLNGRLISVPEDFYDFLMQKYIPEGDFVMARLIGSILGDYPLGVGDGWYALRIKKMLEEKKLITVADKDPSHPYGKVLRKA